MYKFKTSEQNNDKATEFETKSLLYLLTKIKGHSSVNLFIIDCFNDVTAVSDNCSNSWDIQSKNVASLTPRTVGKALYTLFANYVSDIPFGHFILYLPQLKEPYVEDVSVELFTINNFKGTKSADVRTGLKSEIERRNDPDINTPSSVSRLDQFLSEVIFVVDKYGKSDYIKSIIEFKNLSEYQKTGVQVILSSTLKDEEYSSGTKYYNSSGINAINYEPNPNSHILQKKYCDQFMGLIAAFGIIL